MLLKIYEVSKRKVRGEVITTLEEVFYKDSKKNLCKSFTSYDAALDTLYYMRKEDPNLILKSLK